ncbi:MAG: hypothetical protein HZC50_06975 [Nitrospirae bacterium]|nr:hypothetical protein [Nitrospirota bacterium]
MVETKWRWTAQQVVSVPVFRTKACALELLTVELASDWPAGLPPLGMFGQ